MSRNMDAEKKEFAGRTQGLANQTTSDKPFNQVDELISQNKYLQEKIDSYERELLELYRTLRQRGW